jgi:hypothetical protein
VLLVTLEAWNRERMLKGGPGSGSTISPEYFLDISTNESSGRPIQYLFIGTVNIVTGHKN